MQICGLKTPGMHPTQDVKQSIRVSFRVFARGVLSAAEEHSIISALSRTTVCT